MLIYKIDADRVNIKLIYAISYMTQVCLITCIIKANTYYF